MVLFSILLRWVLHSSVTVTVPRWFFMITIGSIVFIFSCFLGGGISTLCSNRMCVWFHLNLQSGIENTSSATKVPLKCSFSHLDLATPVVMTRGDFFISSQFFLSLLLFNSIISQNQPSPKTHVAFPSLDKIQQKIKGIKMWFWPDGRKREVPTVVAWSESSGSGFSWLCSYKTV